MALHVDKLADLEYNEIITLGVIEGDEDLTSVFREVTPLSFKILKSIAKQGKLNDETKELMRGIFDSIICTKTEYIQKYMRLSSADPIAEPVVEPVVEETIEDTVEDTVVEIKVEPVVKKVVKAKITNTKKEVESNKNKKHLPRRFGYNQTMLMIENQGGKATPVQRANLSLNLLKNAYVNLSNRLIKDMLLDTKILSDDDYRTINSTVRLLLNKLEPILKKK